MKLINVLKKFSASDLSELMKTSEKISHLNHQRFTKFQGNDSHNAVCAIDAFNGDSYKHIDEKNWNDSQNTFAQINLRILSGLYGILKPFDLIEAYRLEMGTKLQIGSADDLYEFWTDKLTTHLNMEITKNSVSHIINLASNEYSEVINWKTVTVPKINIHFYELRSGEEKKIAIYSKLARGKMTDYLINSLDLSLSTIKKFKWNGYTYENAKSSCNDLVFMR
jgi:cytoplasmic iron level regulating protein YaaA (DUF328/UPF0246 family)